MSGRTPLIIGTGGKALEFRYRFDQCWRLTFYDEWNVMGREDSRDVADHDACNAFNGGE